MADLTTTPGGMSPRPESLRPRNASEGGTIDNAVKFYDQVIDENRDKAGFQAGLKSVSSKVAKGLIALSGLHEVERSAGELGWDVGSGASAGQIAKSGGMLAANSALTAISFLPAGKVVSGMARGERLLQTAKAGTEIAGLGKAGTQVAKGVADEVAGAVSRAMPQAGKVTAQHTGQALENLTAVGERYGVKIRQGGTVGESAGTVDNILVNTKIGGDHEIVHVAQQLQSRATLLEAKAQSLGKPISQLAAAEKAEVGKQVQALKRGPISITFE